MITIEIPFPPGILSPNNRAHRLKKLPHYKKYRDDCYYLAKQLKPEFAEGKIKTVVIFHEPDSRGRDTDNMHSMIKGALDGISLAWGINDKRLRPITIDDGEIVKGGKVVITFGK